MKRSDLKKKRKPLKVQEMKKSFFIGLSGLLLTIHSTVETCVLVQIPSILLLTRSPFTALVLLFNQPWHQRMHVIVLCSSRIWSMEKQISQDFSTKI